MTLQELTDEIALHVRDDYLKENFFKGWINDALLAIATDNRLPALKRNEPFNLPVNPGAWLYDLPEVYHHGLFRCRNLAWAPVTLLDTISDLDSWDIDHDETGDEITHAAVWGNKLGVYPKANDTARLWFQNKPEVLDVPENRVVCIPEQFQRRVIIPKVIIQAFPIITDMGVEMPHKSLSYWQQKYSEGLFGSPRGEIGMVPWLAIQKPIRRHGGRQPLP
jgi:hypothetical protein